MLSFFNPNRATQSRGAEATKPDTFQLLVHSRGCGISFQLGSTWSALPEMENHIEKENLQRQESSLYSPSFTGLDSAASTRGIGMQRGSTGRFWTEDEGCLIL